MCLREIAQVWLLLEVFHSLKSVSKHQSLCPTAVQSAGAITSVHVYRAMPYPAPAVHSEDTDPCAQAGLSPPGRPCFTPHVTEQLLKGTEQTRVQFTRAGGH